jgi:ATP-binding cassette subfamily B protein
MGLLRQAKSTGTARRRLKPAGSFKVSAFATQARGLGACSIGVVIPEGEVSPSSAKTASEATFIKLLTRLYHPDRGRILLDGKDLEDWDEDLLRHHQRRHFKTSRSTS